MELIPETKFTLPSYLQGRNTFVLHVNVTPVNDPPVLNLLPGKVLRLTQVRHCIFERRIVAVLITEPFVYIIIYNLIFKIHIIKLICRIIQDV